MAHASILDPGPILVFFHDWLEIMQPCLMVDEGINDLVAALWLNWAFTLASIVILYYDYLLTFADEVQYIWFSQRFWTLPSITFFLNRYIGLLTHAAIAYEVLGAHATNSVTHVLFPPIVARRCHGSATSLCRTDVSLGTGVVAIWAITMRRNETESNDVLLGTLISQLPGCNFLFTSNDGIRFGISWSGVLLFDLLVFLLTARVGLREFRHTSSKLWQTIFYNGALYFLILFIANLVNILAEFVAPPFFKGVFGTPTNVLSTTLVSRLFINLRVANAHLLEVRMRPDTGHIMFTTNMFPSTDPGDSADTEGNLGYEGREPGPSARQCDATRGSTTREGEAGPSIVAEKDVNTV
ncbi:hypothetical protein PENSPDRAFT_752196 [Peniophora sp. CONT]|nr:hypothetical protein PENSPDRAFT_752196 [Peniophora sp. CONT]